MLCMNESNYNNIATTSPTHISPSYPSRSSDIWSLGCLLYELLFGSALFADKPWTELYMTLSKNPQYDSSILELEKKLTKSLQSAHNEVLDNIVKLLKKVLEQNPEKRCSISQLIIDVSNILDTYFSGKSYYIFINISNIINI